MHCLFGSSVLQSLSVSLLHFLFSGFSASFATNSVFLGTLFKCFMRFEVVFLSDNSVLFPAYRVQRTQILRIFIHKNKVMFIFLSMKSNPCVHYLITRKIAETWDTRNNRTITTVISHSRYGTKAEAQGRSQDKRMCINKNNFI